VNELALFAGAGGGILGGKLLGWRTVCAVEFDPYARSVLMARQNDGCLEPFPIWDDVRTFNGWPWRGCVDVVSGGFPCQDISAAGKGAGIGGARSRLWGEMARIIREVGPRYVFVENSPMLTSRGLGRVLGDLAEMGFDARWGVLGAVHAGAPHKRDRIWIVADASSQRHVQPVEALCAGRNASVAGGEVVHADSLRKLQPEGSKPDERRWTGAGGEDVGNADGSRFQEQWGAGADGTEHQAVECGSWWAAEPDVGRMAHGVAHRVDRLRGLGNGQVPAVVRLAWHTLTAPRS
jgi:DNA (cytosine-5)-methyltransferase 1